MRTDFQRDSSELVIDRKELNALRETVAHHPYYQPARVMMLRYLYLLHDATFDEELRRAAIFLTDRKVLFELVEAAHYRIQGNKHDSAERSAMREVYHSQEDGSRTVSLIDTYLSNEVKEEQEPKPTVIDATTDYMAYLMQTDYTQIGSEEMNGESLIDDFLSKDGGKITLKEEVTYSPEMTIENDSEVDEDNEIITENMAGIYIKQGRYKKALAVMQKINAKTPKKGPYYEDQERFLKKLILAKGNQTTKQPNNQTTKQLKKHN